jgi:class 3 adenylate cyclase
MNMRIGNEAMAAVRRRHFERVRMLVEELGGCEVKTLGDGFFLVFRSSVDALDFGLRLQRDTGDPTVEVRVGIHVGIFRIEDHDAFGAAVNYAARVAATASAGEIIVSERVMHDMQEERLTRHEGLRLAENPDCELKGFQGAQRLWTVRAGD